MPFQSKTQVSAISPATDVSTARRLLNLAGRGVDAAFRSLTLDTLMVRGKTTLGSLKAGTTSLTSTTITGNETVSGNLTVSGNETVNGNLTLNGNFPYYWKTLGFAGSLAGSAGTTANPWKVQFGTQVVVTNAAGDSAITYPSAFPNGVIVTFTQNGDQGSGPFLVQPYPGITSTTAFSLNVRNSTTNAAVVGSVRVNWLVIGW